MTEGASDDTLILSSDEEEVAPLPIPEVPMFEYEWTEKDLRFARHGPWLAMGRERYDQDKIEYEEYVRTYTERGLGAKIKV